MNFNTIKISSQYDTLISFASVRTGSTIETNATTSQLMRQNRIFSNLTYTHTH